MQIVPIEGITLRSLESNEDTTPRDEKWDRHIPEGPFDEELLHAVIAHKLWEETEYKRMDSIPLPFMQDSKDGCIAELNIGNHEAWDERGRLQCTIRVYYFPPDATDERKQLAFEQAREFPIFYSVVSSLKKYGERFPCIMYELPATQYNLQDLCDVANGSQLPILTVPPKHPYYQAGGDLKPRTVQSGFVPENQEDEESSYEARYDENGRRIVEDWEDRNDLDDQSVADDD